VDEVNLEIPDSGLEKIGKEGVLEKVLPDGREVRRGPLALSIAELKVIRDYFRKEGRNPTDVEVESIGQTWSEHCKHTIFAAELDEIKGGLFKDLIKRQIVSLNATNQYLSESSKPIQNTTCHVPMSSPTNYPKFAKWKK
jgi:phosphoribosylformylglycinamidine synthase